MGGGGVDGDSVFSLCEHKSTTNLWTLIDNINYPKKNQPYKTSGISIFKDVMFMKWTTYSGIMLHIIINSIPLSKFIYCYMVYSNGHKMSLK